MFALDSNINFDIMNYSDTILLTIVISALVLLSPILHAVYIYINKCCNVLQKYRSFKKKVKVLLILFGFSHSMD